MTDDPVVRAAEAAINQLVGLLTEARACLEQNEIRMALGTLFMFDDHADDLRAAIRLLQMMARRRP
jgi:hypothetical protein